MSEEKIALTPDEKLAVCNMTSSGTKMGDAIARIRVARKRNGAATKAAEEGEKKASAKDKKAALAKEIEAAGGEVPAVNSSVAKFEEALTTAKTEAAKTEAGDDLM